MLYVVNKYDLLLENNECDCESVSEDSVSSGVNEFGVELEELHSEDGKMGQGDGVHWCLCFFIRPSK